MQFNKIHFCESWSRLYNRREVLHNNYPTSFANDENFFATTDLSTFRSHYNFRKHFLRFVICQERTFHSAAAFLSISFMLQFSITVA